MKYARLIIFITTMFNIAFAMNMPKPLYDIAKKSSCMKTFEFYESKRVRLFPPYVFGIVDDLELYESAAIWCDTGKDKKILIYLSDDEKKKKFSCPTIVSPIKNDTDGLTLKHLKNVQLDSFVEIETLKKGTGVIKEKNALYTGYESGDLIFCHEGKWWIKNVH